MVWVLSCCWFGLVGCEILVCGWLMLVGVISLLWLGCLLLFCCGWFGFCWLGAVVAVLFLVRMLRCCRCLLVSVCLCFWLISWLL